MKGGGESAASSRRNPAKEKCAAVTSPEISLATDAHPRTRADIATDLANSGLPGDVKASTAKIVNEALVRFRLYQKPVFLDRESGILILHWSRQIGKSYTLASWAVDRLLTQLTKYDSWLITVLSNSRDNGAEFVIKCQDVCNKIGIAMEKPAEQIGDAMVYNAADNSPDLKYENMRMEVRITLTVNGRERIGRIKVLAANPRTARGFSGDLILDEFAFHEDSNAIWEAAEPILSANPEFLCRIASTGNGKHNMFYRMVAGTGPADGTVFTSTAGFKVCRVTRSAAWRMGVKIYDPNTRLPITPEEARKKALDKRAYDQNYECAFADENMALLTHELIQQAMRDGIPIDEQEWSTVSFARMWRAEGDLFFGLDVGRNRDISFLPVIEKVGKTKRVIAALRMSGMRLPDQQKQLDRIMIMPKMRAGRIDMTGLGLGLCEYAQDKWDAFRIQGVNFSSTEPINDKIRAEGRKAEKVRVTENMATDLLNVFEDRSIELHIEMDADAVDDLRKPEKITSPGGRVSIAAVRDEAGHADHFWGLALAIRAMEKNSGPFACERARSTRRSEAQHHRRGCVV
jgi:phage FluMu gp28-like protein